MNRYQDNDRTRKSRRRFSERLIRGELADAQTGTAVRMIREMLASGDRNRMQAARIAALMHQANENSKVSPDFEEVYVRELAERVRDGGITLASAAERLVRFGIRDEMIGAAMDQLESDGLSFAEAVENASTKVMLLGDFPIKPSREPGESLIAYDARLHNAERRLKNARKRLERVLRGNSD